MIYFQLYIQKLYTYFGNFMGRRERGGGPECWGFKHPPFDPICCCCCCLVACQLKGWWCTRKNPAYPDYGQFRDFVWGRNNKCWESPPPPPPPPRHHGLGQIVKHLPWKKSRIRYYSWESILRICHHKLYRM